MARHPRPSSTATTTTGSRPGPTGSSKLHAVSSVSACSTEARRGTGSSMACPTSTAVLVVSARRASCCRRPTSRCAPSTADVLDRLGEADLVLVDVRSPAEYGVRSWRGQAWASSAQRAGHIPGAVSAPWAQTARDGTFRSASELRSPLRRQGCGRGQGHRDVLPHRGAFPATAGSSSTSCWAIRASATTTAPGPSGLGDRRPHREPLGPGCLTSTPPA